MEVMKLRASVFSVVVLAGCWETTSSTKPFVTNLWIDGRELVVDRCELRKHSEHVFMPTRIGVSLDLRSLRRGDCDVRADPLPAGMFPGDGLEDQTPPWCRRSIAAWRRAGRRDREAIRDREQARLDAIRDRAVSDCTREYTSGFQRAQAVADLGRRTRMLQALPSCDRPRQIVALPDEAPPSEQRTEAWSRIPTVCRDAIEGGS